MYVLFDLCTSQIIKNSSDCQMSSAEMSAAVPNHRRTKPGGKIKLNFKNYLHAFLNQITKHFLKNDFWWLIFHICKCCSHFITGIKTGVVTSGVTGPTSQIPGLSQKADETSPVERISGRRVGIFESDSDYVKLAKGGGHKGKRLVGSSM